MLVRENIIKCVHSKHQLRLVPNIKDYSNVMWQKGDILAYGLLC